MICQFTLFPVVTQRYGALYCMKICTAVFPVTYMLTPYAVLMPTSGLKQAALMAVLIIKALATVFAFPCITILMTNSAKSLQILGTLNGFAVSLSAVGRAIGPYVSGWVFTWGAENGYVVASWWLMAIFAIPGHILCYWLIEMEGFGVSDEKSYEEMQEAIIINTNGPLESSPLELELEDLQEEEDKLDKDDDDSVVEDLPLLDSQRKL